MLIVDIHIRVLLVLILTKDPNMTMLFSYIMTFFRRNDIWFGIRKIWALKLLCFLSSQHFWGKGITLGLNKQPFWFFFFTLAVQDLNVIVTITWKHRNKSFRSLFNMSTQQYTCKSIYVSKYTCLRASLVVQW